jgi:hypothetical protein
VLAFHAGLDLSSNTDTVAGFDAFDLGANAKDLADDFVTNTKRCDGEVAPGDGVNIGVADTAAFVFDINIVILEDLGGEL